MANCVTHHVCDCGAEWRRDATALLRDLVDFDRSDKPSVDWWFLLVSEAERLLGEEKPDGEA